MRRGNGSLQVICRCAVSDKAEKGSFPVFINKRKPFIDEQIKGGFETMNKNLKKVISAASALAVSASSIAAFAASYPDVATTADYYQAVNELSALGVIAGFEDGTFKPEENVTRAQITKMVVTALGNQVSSAAEAASGKDTQFADVPGSHWAAGFVSVGTSSSAQNFINGYSATAFGPEDNVTYAQAIKMLVAALGYSSLAEGAGGWPSGYLKYGYSLGLTTGLSGIGNDQQLNRAQVAVLIDNALKCPICVSNGVTYNQFGQQIPVTLVKDGTGDLDGSKDGYQNLLNYAHDAYLVYGRVSATNKSGDGVEVGEIKFTVEKSDNWEGYSINAAKGESSDPVTAYKGQVTDADKYLFTYSEAILQKDINDEYTLVSLTPYGSSEILTLNTGDYKEYNKDTKQLKMYKDAGRSKYDTYKFDAEIDDNTDFSKVYVNGATYDKAAADLEAFFNGQYVDGNKVGQITLIDKTDEGKSSTDGKYDVIMVSYYVDGIIDDVEVDTDEIVITLDEADAVIGKGEIVLDLEDEDADYSITLDGESIDASELQPGDVVSVAYDVNDDFEDSLSYDIVVSRNKVEGKVTSIYEDKDKDGNITLDTEYSLDDGNVYKLAYEDAAKLTNGNSYTLYLDAFGKVVKADELASSKKYGIVENLYKSNGGSDPYVDIITATGEKVSYAVNSDDFADLENKFFGGNFDDPNKFGDSKGETEADKKGVRGDAVDRVIEYTVTTKGELRVKDLAPDGDSINGEYKTATAKLDKRQLSESLTSIVDLSEYDYTTSQSYTSVAMDSLTAGTKYTGKAFGAIGTDKVYQFVVITSGIGGYNVEKPWAVFVQSSNIDTDNGSMDAVVAYVNGEDKPRTIAVDGINVEDFKAGDVFFYKTNSDGEIEDYKLVSTLGDGSYQSFYKTAMDVENNSFDFVIPATAADFKGAAFSKGEYNDDECMLISGPIVDVTNGNVKIATKVTNATEIDDEGKSVDVLAIDDVDDYSLASDVKVYGYDYSVNRARDRVFVTSNNKVVKASTFNRDSYFGDKVDNFVMFEKEFETIKDAANKNYGKTYFAVAKVLDDEITEILVIIPDGSDD